MSWDVMVDPLFNKKITSNIDMRMQGSRVNNKAYFPMAVQFRQPCRQSWNANCLSFSTTQNLRIPLIPVLDDPNECKRIADQALSERCRQLNTYRAAFRRVETITEVRADKELCQHVDRGPGSARCLEHLQGYIANPQLFDNRLPLQTEIEPIEQVLVLEPMAGMSAGGPGSKVDPFKERATYSVCYSALVKLPSGQSACVSVVQFAGEMTAHNWQPGTVTIDGHAAIESIETIAGQSIKTVEFPNFRRVNWPAGNFVIAIIFYRDAVLPAREISLSMRRELVRQYLAKYPSSLATLLSR